MKNAVPASFYMQKTGYLTLDLKKKAVTEKRCSNRHKWYSTFDIIKIGIDREE